MKIKAINFLTRKGLINKIIGNILLTICLILNK